jgi:UDP-N-acetylglucosamine acyltransferase
VPIHPTAIVDRRAEVDESAEVGPFCVVDAGVRIGARTRLWQNVHVTGRTELGESCELHPGVVVGHVPQDTGYKGEPTGCRIGARTILREHVTIHRGSREGGTTVVGADCFLLAGSHVAHDCVLGDRVLLVNNALLAGHVHVDDRAVVSGAAAVHQFARIGELAMVSGLARVPKDVVPFALLGVDGRIAGINTIGLRRAGFSREEILDVRRAFRLLFARDRGTVEEAAQRVQDACGSEPVRRLLAFVRGPSKRGLAGRARSGFEDDGAA